MKEILKIPYSEFDYPALMNALGKYKFARDRVTKLISSGVIIRVKKGIYIKGEDYRQILVRREVLANMIYGPSYISLEYALSFYQLIPEKVETLTSVTSGKNKIFNTQAGRFSYRHIPLPFLYKGVASIQLPDARAYLFASPEKALVDYIYLESGIDSKRNLEVLLFDNMRMDEYVLQKLDKSMMLYIIKDYKKKAFNYLIELLDGLKK